MEIRVCKTSEIIEDDWKTYADSFNTVFRKNFSVSFFKHKYTSVDGEESYHSLLYNNTEVVGGCTILPCEYLADDKEIKIALACDVFIREECRTDPFMLRRMYKNLKKVLKDDGFTAVLAVPNATAYPYWKNVVKWKDVGKLDYWILPLRFGNVLGKHKLLNLLSIPFSYLCIGISYLFFNTSSKNYKYALSKRSNFYKHRFDSATKNVNLRGYFYSLRIVDEKGVRTGYIYTAEMSGKRNMKCLRTAVKDLISDKVDIIIYVGKMGFPQNLLFKVPRKMEPKLLPLTCDLVDENYHDPDLYNIKEWDFGLINYDVR